MAVRRLLKNVHARKVGRFMMRFAPVVKVFHKPLEFASKCIKICLRISPKKSPRKSKFRESELGIRRLAVVRGHELGEVRAISQRASNGHFRSLIQLHVMETPPSCRTHSYYNLHTVLRNLSFTTENGRDLNMIARVLNLQITAPFLEQVLKIQLANRVSVELFSGYFGTCFDSNNLWRVKTPLHHLQALSAEELKACANYDMATSSERLFSDPNHDDEMTLQSEHNGSPTKFAACRFSKLFLTSTTEQFALLYDSHSNKIARVEQNQAENVPVPKSLDSRARQLQLKVNRFDDPSSFQQRPCLRGGFLELDREQNKIRNTKAPCSSLKENKDLSLQQLSKQLSRHAEPMGTDEAAEDVQPQKRHPDNSSGVVQSVGSFAQDRRLEGLQNQEANANPSNSFSEKNEVSLVEDSFKQMFAGSIPEKDRSNSDLEENECLIARGISAQAATVGQPPALNLLRLSLRTTEKGSSCQMAFHEGTPIHHPYSDSDALTESSRNHRNLSESETLDDAQRVFSLTDPKNRSLNENPDMKIDRSLPTSMQVSASSYVHDSNPSDLGKVSMTKDVQIVSAGYRENELTSASDSGELRKIPKVFDKEMNRYTHTLHGRFEIKQSNSPTSRKPGKAHTTDINQDAHSLLTNKRKRSSGSDVGPTKRRKSQKTKNADIHSNRIDLTQEDDVVSLGKRPQRIAKINAKVKLNNTRRRSS